MLIIDKKRVHILQMSFYSFFEFAAVCFALTTLLAARHIHLNSQKIEQLGIRANSTVIKLYVIFWFVLAIATAVSVTITLTFDVL